MSMDKFNDLSRRDFLKLGAAGALAGAPARYVLAGEHDLPPAGHWDREVDIVVVGSGAAGCSAALFASDAKASVTILEKSFIFGGTTAKSGGVFWIPNNFIMRERGLKDSRHQLLRYLARASFPTLYKPHDETRFGMPENVHKLHRTFFDNAAGVVDRLREMGLKCELEWTFDKKPMPDYNAQLPENHGKSWRTILPTPVDGLEGGASLIHQLRGIIEKRKIPVMMSHRVTRLVVTGSGRIAGVEAENEDGKSLTFKAGKGVIFGTGGFTANPEMCLNFLRGPILGGCSADTNEGDFVPMATAVNASLGNMNSAWWWSVIVEQALQSRIVPRGIGQIPGDSSILVNAYGKRCVNEKIQYNERTQAHFVWDPVRARYPNHIMLMIYDQSCRDRFADSPIARALGGGLIAEQGTTAAHVISAPSLDILEKKIRTRLGEISHRTGNYQLDDSFTENLRNTVLRYNAFAKAGVDEDFHRGESPVELAFHGDPRGNPGPNVTMRPLSSRGPYYCVLIAGGTLDTNGGPQINSRAEILDYDDQPIPGLYGAGNCVASPAGQGYWAGGATIGLALTFGAIAALNAVKTDIPPATDPSGA